jgi:hypothetical protein
MADEYDELLDPIVMERRARAAAEEHAHLGASSRRPVSRLISRLYVAAHPQLRVRLLACLLRPLGPLATVGIAAGAFSMFLVRGGNDSARAALGDVARISNEQVVELARFVEQVSPEALLEYARIVSDNSVGMAAFSVSAAVLLMRLLRPRDPAARPVRRATSR